MTHVYLCDAYKAAGFSKLLRLARDYFFLTRVNVFLYTSVNDVYRYSLTLINEEVLYVKISLIAINS